MSYLTADPVTLLETRSAIATAIGCPLKPRCFKDGVEVFDVVPVAYVPGLWRDYEPEVVVSDDGTIAAMEVYAVAEAHLGKTVKVAGKDVKIADRATLKERAALPAKVAEVLARNEALEDKSADDGGVKGAAKAAKVRS